MVKIGFAVYPLPFPPTGIVRETTGPGLVPPLSVAVADGVPPTGVAPERETVGGFPAWYEPPAVTLMLLI